jgi:hypothetical protein
MKKLVNDIPEVISFQSPEAVDAIRSAAKRIPELQKAAANARRIFNMVQSNPAAIELQGKSPVEETRNARTKAEQAENEVQRARAELAQLVLSERADFDVMRGRMLASLNETTILPAATQLRALVAQVEAIIGDLIDKVSSISVSNGSTEIDRFDAGIVTWNKLIAECCAPSNALIAPLDAIRISAANLYLQSARDVQKLTLAVARLQDAVAKTQSRIAKASSTK